jgi:hypothetical protein
MNERIQAVYVGSFRLMIADVQVSCIRTMCSTWAMRSRYSSWAEAHLLSHIAERWACGVGIRTTIGE